MNLEIYKQVLKHCQDWIYAVGVEFTMPASTGQKLVSCLSAPVNLSMNFQDSRYENSPNNSQHEKASTGNTVSACWGFKLYYGVYIQHQSDINFSLRTQ